MCIRHDVVVCIAKTDRTQLANCGLCVPSHPPDLDALTALRSQDQPSWGAGSTTQDMPTSVSCAGSFARTGVSALRQ
jgi:hypothetical protein